MSHGTRITLRVIAILVVIAIAGALRARAVARLPIDYDEDDYLRAAQEFAHLIRTSDWAGLLDTNYRPEHPPLAKFAYGLAILGLPEQPLTPDVSITANPASSLPGDQLRAARTEAAIFGTLTAALLALVNPLGGLMLDIHTFTIKYTSQVMLDGLAALLSFGTVLAYTQYKKKGRAGWLIASAILLGLAADTKFLHGTVGLAILLDYLYNKRTSIATAGVRKRTLLTILLWGILAVGVFVIADPYLWSDPAAHIRETLAAVQYTTTNPNVARAGYPLWQQLNWLSMSVPWDQNAAFILRVDTLIAVLAIVGFRRMWEKESAFGFWLVLELIVLLLWRTKWPQYLLVITAPFALSAGEGLSVIWNSLSAWWENRKTAYSVEPARNDTRRALPWLVPGVLAFAVLTLVPLIFQFGMSMTDFSSASLRDGLNGGIWRALSQGLTGQEAIRSFDMGSMPKQVNFTGLNSYGPVLGYLAGGANGWSILFFNVMWTILSVLLQLGLGLAVALLLWQKGVRLGRAWQALFVLPWAIPEYIGALMWFNIFQRDWGWLYLAADKYGAGSIFAAIVGNLEAGPSLWLLRYLLPAMWYGFPFMMLAASVGLKSIPKEVFDAASIDGANSGQTFRYVTWPLLLPLLIPAIVVRSIFAFNQFYLFQAFFFGDATLASLSYNIFNPAGGFGSRGGYFAVSAVINIIAVVILMGLVILFNRWSRTKEGAAYA